MVKNFFPRYACVALLVFLVIDHSAFADDHNSAPDPGYEVWDDWGENFEPIDCNGVWTSCNESCVSTYVILNNADQTQNGKPCASKEGDTMICKFGQGSCTSRHIKIIDGVIEKFWNVLGVRDVFRLVNNILLTLAAILLLGASLRLPTESFMAINPVLKGYGTLSPLSFAGDELLQALFTTVFANLFTALDYALHFFHSKLLTLRDDPSYDRLWSESVKMMSNDTAISAIENHIFNVTNESSVVLKELEGLIEDVEAEMDTVYRMESRQDEFRASTDRTELAALRLLHAVEGSDTSDVDATGTSYGGEENVHLYKGQQMLGKIDKSPSHSADMQLLQRRLHEAADEAMGTLSVWQTRGGGAHSTIQAEGDSTKRHISSRHVGPSHLFATLDEFAKLFRGKRGSNTGGGIEATRDK